MKKLILILILLIVFLYYQLYQIININYITEPNETLKPYNIQNALILHKNYELKHLPHLNIKGTVDTIQNNKIKIKLSEASKDFLLTQYIELANSSFLTKLKENQNIFIVLKDIQINKNILKFTNVSIYTPIDINFENSSHGCLIVKNDFGGYLNLKGISFSYNDNSYFLENSLADKYKDDLFYENVETGILLIEPLKHSFIPVIYNLINPQETMFEKVLGIYNP